MRKLLLWSVALWCIMCSSSAIAEDAIFTGAECVVPEEDVDYADYNTDGGVWAESGNTITVVCPIVRDITTSDDFKVGVMVTDSSALTRILCTAYGTDEYGDGGASDSDSTTYSFTGDDTLEMDLDSGEGTTAKYFFSCTVPGGSGILAYKVFEPRP